MRNIKYWLQRRIRGWSDDETWNLNENLILWINSRFKKYKEDASQVVDLEFHTYQYKGKKYTKLQIIDRIINITNKYICVCNNDYFEIRVMEKEIKELFELLNLVFWDMRW